MLKATTILMIFLFVGFLSCSEENEIVDKPNIIFIMSDDHASHAISAYGSAINSTPNLDRIAENGMLFENAFCTNSICAPSRAVILTGKYNHINGVIDNSRTFDGSQQTLPKILKANGYQTAIFGKWHLKSAPTGFDRWKVLPGQGFYYNPAFIDQGVRKIDTGYVTDIITDNAIDWLKEEKEDESPFFLIVQHKAPHRNWMPNIPHLNMYDDVEIPYPDDLFDNYEGRGRAAKEQTLSIAKDMTWSHDLKFFQDDEVDPDRVPGWMENRFKGLTSDQISAIKNAYREKNKKFLEANLEGEDLIKWKYQRYIKDYLRVIASVDDNIGKLLDYLESYGLSENTLIMYTSDQGFYLGDHGWFDKRFMYEESYRMPLLVQYPKVINGGIKSDDLVLNLDFASTMLDFAGIPVPEDIQGESFKNILITGEAPTNWRDAVYYHYFEYPGSHMVKRHYGVRTDRYKLMHFYHDIDEWEMYDLETDPGEMSSIYGQPEYAEIEQSLKEKIAKLQEQYGDDPEEFGSFESKRNIEHLGLNIPLKILTKPAKQYSQNWESALTDGVFRETNRYSRIRFRDYLGFQHDFEGTMDLGSKKKINKIALSTYQETGAWIHFPEKVSFFQSDDGKIFEKIGELSNDQVGDEPGSMLISLDDLNLTTRYVKVIANPVLKIPSGNLGEGEISWMFVDELIVQ